jgi:hypothetical protein
MKTVNIHEAKTHLSKLIEEASKGEPFVIAKAGNLSSRSRLSVLQLVLRYVVSGSWPDRFRFRTTSTKWVARRSNGSSLGMVHLERRYR